MIIESNVRCVDPLLGEWPWNEGPMLLVSRPPWLRIKDRFRGHPDGSALRKRLSCQLREFQEPDGRTRFSAIKGNVNLYRLYIERSMQLCQKGGRARLVVPSSVLREKSSLPLRKLLVDCRLVTSRRARDLCQMPHSLSWKEDHGPLGQMHHGPFRRCPDHRLKGLGLFQQ